MSCVLLPIFFALCTAQTEMTPGCKEVGLVQGFDFTTGSLDDLGSVLRSGNARQSNTSYPIPVDYGAHFDDTPYHSGLWVGGPSANLRGQIDDFAIHMEWRSTSVVADRQYLWQMLNEDAEVSSSDFPVTETDMIAGCVLTNGGIMGADAAVRCTVLNDAAEVQSVQSAHIVKPGDYYLMTLQSTRFGGTTRVDLFLNGSLADTNTYSGEWTGVNYGPFDTSFGTPAACSLVTDQCFGFVGDIYSVLITNETVEEGAYAAWWPTCVHASFTAAPTPAPTPTPGVESTTAAASTTTSLKITGGGVGAGGVAVQDDEVGERGSSSGVPVVLVAVLAAVCVVLTLLLALMVLRRSRRRGQADDTSHTLSSPRAGGGELSRSASKGRRKSQSRAGRSRPDGNYSTVNVAAPSAGTQEYVAMPSSRTNSAVDDGASTDDYTTLNFDGADRTHAYGSPDYAVGELDLTKPGDGYSAMPQPYATLDGSRRDGTSVPGDDYQSGDLLVE